jgi:single-stranded-DNA-specific exonuclease
MTKQWIYKSPDPVLTAEIAAHLGISRVTAAVLVNRGITSQQAAKAFIDPQLDGVGNPFLLPDILPAIERIVRAVDRKEKILVYGDRDVDGVTSISIMVRTLASLGAEPLWYIPSDEGYGVHNDIIERYARQGVTLIITVDCGISAVAETEYARGRGIDVVVTDHHEPPSSGIPKAVAVVDPKRADSCYPFSELAGCAVSFKVAEALMMSFGRYFNKDLVFVAAGIGELAAVKCRNGVATGTFACSDAAGAAQNAAAFAAFRGDGIIIGDAAALAARWTAVFGTVLSEEAVDLRERVRRAALPEIAETEIPGGDRGAVDAAARTAQLFGRLERRTDVRMEFFQKNHLDVITLGTIADIMPLVDENRILVKQGLKCLAGSRKIGVQMLLDRCGSKNRTAPLSAKTVSWSITPILNSAGRRGRANLSAELLLTENEGKARGLLDEILQLNSERKELQSENMEKFLPLLREQCDLENDKIFIVTAKGIEHGVTGIIASQIMRQYRRPTLLLIIEGTEAMGAARSVEGFDIVGALGRLRDILVKYGGHSQAAGLTVSVDKLDEFRQRLREIAATEITPEMLVPVVEIDADIDAQDASLELLRELDAMEPYGMGNPYPVFSLKKMKVREHSRVGPKRDHLKLRVSKDGGTPLGAIGWGMGGMEDDIARCASIDMAVQLEMNVWQDKQNLQLMIQDIKTND